MNDLIMNNSDTTNVVLATKKSKKAKKSNNIEFNIEEELPSFVPQVNRKDVLTNMLLNIILGGTLLFEILMSDNHSDPSESRQGGLFETICEILIILKCIPEINYTHILCGNCSSLKQVTNIKSILSKRIQQGGNVSDITIEHDGTIIAFSCKYKKQKKIGKKSTDVSDLDRTLEKQPANYKFGLFVKDKLAISRSNKQDIHKDSFDKVLEDNLLFDTEDIIKALDVFRHRYKDNKLSVEDFIEYNINADLWSSPRKQLVEKLHQRMELLKFINFVNSISASKNKNKNNNVLCADKPRSGKSITLLLWCKYLLETASGYNKILLMTPIIGTITSYIKDLEEYIDFKNINYVTRDTDELESMDPTFRGIVFCSVQYLKSDLKGKKKEFLKNIDFDAIVIDEAHLGSSTIKTQKGILEADPWVNRDIEDIRKKGTKLNIFASGTASKTKKYYGISNANTYEWEIEDEGHMKELLKPNLSLEERDTIIQSMVSKHGPIFMDCLRDNTLDQNYSKHPAQILMKYSIPQDLIDEITAFNSKNGTKFGFSYTSLFALKQEINNEGEVCYAEEFDICKYGQDGIDILKSIFDCIISKNMMNTDTIMKKVETTQTSYNSRKSTVDHPLLFIMYLPTHTRNNTIALLQKTLKAFLEKYQLWSDYNIEYSNSSEDSGDVKEDYNAFIETKMMKTRADKKRGCILLLGDKGSVGITYNDCDVTISLDDGHNLDNYKQRIFRALTPAPKKSVGICVDLNIQRTYLYSNDMIHRYRRNTKTTMTNAEILYYLFEHQIFLFDPQRINNGKLTTIEIMSYYEKEADNIMKEIDDTFILEQIVCDDDLRDIIKSNFQKSKILINKKVNAELEGDQQDCPKGNPTKIQIDAPKNLGISDMENDEDGQGDEEAETLTKEDEHVIEELINQTCEMCKSFLFPLLALISRAYKIYDFKDIFTNDRTQELIVSLLKDKKIDLNKENINMFISIMNQIVDNNDEIVNNIREIYSVAPAHKLRHLIAKHFIPTEAEKKGNAEVPTPVKLVDDMLDSAPLEFWSKPHTVFEPCCGKGNFVLGIFDRFYKGLELLYPDSEERCRIIMTKCIYYADLTALNVFITTEIMKCHVQSYCGLDELDYDFNIYTGDTLEIDILTTFGLTIFDAVIGNPPYSTDPSKPETKPLYDKFIEKYIDACGILLFVVPSRWFVGGKGLDKFRDFMMIRKDIVLIQHEDDATKWFGNNVDIKGGVNYFLKDVKHEGLCLFNGTNYNLTKYDCIIKPKYHQIIDAVSSMESVNKLYMGRFFGVETNDKRFKDNGKIKCYVSTLKSKDRCKYIDNYDFNEKNTFWKVITPEASFKAFSGFGEIFIGKPDEVHTGSYISFRVQSEEEAKSLLSYLNTKFANHILSVRKISQHINGDVCKWIPLVPLDRIWTDDVVCEYLKIENTIYI